MYFVCTLLLKLDLDSSIFVYYINSIEFIVMFIKLYHFTKLKKELLFKKFLDNFKGDNKCKIWQIALTFKSHGVKPRTIDD